MDFFKSVFSNEPELSDTETTPTSPSNSETQPNPNPNPSAWGFGSTLLRTIASKSESLAQNYRRDLEEFSSGLKLETAAIREVASRAVKELPARLESGAGFAQDSLESVGQAIDDIGLTVTEIIASRGKDYSLLSRSERELDNNNNNNNCGLKLNLNENASKPYSRIDELIRKIQRDVRTYCEEVEDLGDYDEWRLGFVLEEESEEIEDLVKENELIVEIYSEVVPSRVDHETFWSRYFYRVYRVRKAEEARARLVKRAISGEEEELSWDVDDDDDNEDAGVSGRVDDGEKMDNVGVSVSGEDEKVSGLETKSEGGDDKVGGDRGSSEAKNDISDFSIVSSQPSSHEGDDLGWDEIEDIPSGDESKVSERMSPNKDDLRKRLSAAEEDEELTWDIEDEDDVPAKSS